MSTSTGNRGFRGGADRGIRGGRVNPFRGGGVARGRGNGSDAVMRDTTPDAPRGGRGGFNARGRGNGTNAFIRDTAPDAPRGGRGGRGGFNPRGDKPLYRGRGHHQGSNSKFAAGSSSASVSNGSMNSTPYPDHDYAKRLEFLRNDRPRLREELVSRRLMNPDGPMNLADSVVLHGICEDMCPEYERVRRIVENDYKAAECTPETAHGPRLERVPDETRMVKAFTRSAAGQEEELVSDKRTPATCLKTLDYMFRRIDEDGLDFLYQWLWDRTRSVRKDMVGTIKPKDITAYLTSVEQCARFHLVSLHEMAGSSSANYDHSTDHGNDVEQLRNCFTSLRHRYDDNEKTGIRNAHQAEFAAYDLILSLVSRGNNTQLEDNPERSKDKFSHNRRVRAAYVIRQAGLAVMSKVAESFPTKKQNWANFWQAVNEEDVSFLMACAAEISFNQIRYHVMETLRLAYKPKKSGKPGPVNDWTPENLMHALGFDDHDQVKEFCGHYGLGFVVGDQGVEVLDVQSMPPGRLEKPPELRPQHFSRDIVEPKRLGRSFLNVIQTNLKENDLEQEDSLFVTEPSISRTLNPNATAFKPPEVSPFSYMTSAAPKSTLFTNPTQPNGINPTTPAIKPGIFDASKNSIQFADNPFAKPAAAPGPASAPASAPSSLFPNNPMFPSSSPAPTTPGLFTKPFAPNTTQAPLQKEPSQGFSFLPSPQPVESIRDEEREKAEEQKRKAEEQKRIEEEKIRIQEENDRKARAAEEQRRLQQEQERQRVLREEQERQRLIQEEAQRQALAERQRQWEAEQLRRTKEEAERYEKEEKARAYSTLSNSLLMDEDEGLMRQFIDHKLQFMVKEIAQELEEQRLERVAEERYQQKRMIFTRAVCARWWEQVQRKKKRAGARHRREKLKALRAGAVKENLALGQQPVIQTNGTPDAFRKPDTPASAQRPNQSAFDQTTTSQNNKQSTQKEKTAEKQGTKDTQSPTNVISQPLDTASHDYSDAYYNSTAPIDRTETDWFKLRAMGVDPSEHRKRNYGSMSSDDEDAEADAKRARRSTSSTFRRSLPPPTTDEERFARFRAVRDAYNRGSATPQSTGRNRSVSVISQARDLLFGSPVAQHSHQTDSEARRSASASGFANPPQLSMFGRSIGAAVPGQAAAYKSRPSRFVPAHLYGKGGEAARAYREESRNRLSTGSSTEVFNPVNQSPSQFPKASTEIPFHAVNGQNGEVQAEAYEDEDDLIVYSTSDGEEGGEDATPSHIVHGQQQAIYDEEGYEAEETDEELDDELDEEYANDDWDAYDQNEEDYEEDEEEEDYDESFAQNAQMPGASQADAIELSDSD